MTHQEFYESANNLVSGLNCYYVSADINKTRHSHLREPITAYHIAFQFGDQNKKFEIMAQGVGYQAATEALQNAAEWIKKNKRNPIIK